jgi:hypothetical protein
MASKMRPKQAADFYSEELEGEVVLFRLGSSNTLHLNETAALVWKLADGTRTGSDIAAFLASEYPDAAEDIAVDVERALAELASHGVLVASDAETASH